MTTIHSSPNGTVEEREGKFYVRERGNLVEYQSFEQACPTREKYSKLKLLRGIVSSGKGSAFLAFISSDPVRQALWDAANVIYSDDPDVSLLRPNLPAVLGLTKSQVDEIFTDSLI